MTGSGWINFVHDGEKWRWEYYSPSGDREARGRACYSLAASVRRCVNTFAAFNFTGKFNYQTEVAEWARDNLSAILFLGDYTTEEKPSEEDSRTEILDVLAEFIP